MKTLDVQNKVCSSLFIYYKSSTGLLDTALCLYPQSKTMTYIFILLQNTSKG